MTRLEKMMCWCTEKLPRYAALTVAVLFVIIVAVQIGMYKERQAEPVIKFVEVPVKVPVKIKLVATGYCNESRCINVGKWQDGKTASNTIARHGVCAADWNVFPQGTRLLIPGYGECLVEDRGGKINGLHVDLFFNEHQDAKEWGYKTVIAEVLEPKTS
ncbi:MAG: 3D domain-containing protein [Deltaproteobacteria bacterium]|nr:3D domain-containing protein [Deltaproteobacteria bacterium]